MFEEVLSRLKPQIKESELPPGWWGAYDLTTNTIHLHPLLAPIQRRSTLSHETAHAVLGHTGHCPRQERKAEELSASWLIRHELFVAACKIHDTATAIAAELDVLPRDVQAYKRLLQRPSIGCPARMDSLSSFVNTKVRNASLDLSFMQFIPLQGFGVRNGDPMTSLSVMKSGLIR